jgi:ATP-binding protein involved in chromosome partitioning
MPKSIAEDDILSCLSEISDPSQDKDIVSLGLVETIQINQSDVCVILEVPTHRVAALEFLRLKVEQKILAMDGINSATVIMTAHKDENTTPEKAEETPSDHQNKVLESKVKRFVAVGSGKGGVGKSTTAVNIAVSLKLLGLRVGLLDADVYGPSQPRMLGVSGKPPAVGGDMVAPLENYGIKLMSMGLLVPDDVAMIWRGPMVQSALTQMLNSVVWGELDIIIIDLPPGTGDIQISLAQQVNLAGAVIVSTPQDIALLDVVKAITMFEKAGVKVLGMIQNMAVWECPDCGRIDHIFGEGGVEREAEKRGIELFGEIPLSSSIRERSDSGMPLVVTDPGSSQAEIYQDIAKKIVAKLDM